LNSSPLQTFNIHRQITARRHFNAGSATFLKSLLSFETTTGEYPLFALLLGVLQHFIMVSAEAICCMKVPPQ
jgi:hypothetical protein